MRILNKVYTLDANANDNISIGLKGIVKTLNAIVDLKGLAPKLNELFSNSIAPSIEKMLANEKIGFSTIREFSQKYLTDDGAENLQKHLYATDDNGHTPLASIKVGDAKKEIMLSVDRILKLIFVLPNHEADLYKNISNPLQQASLTFADLITMAIDKKPLTQNPN